MQMSTKYGRITIPNHLLLHAVLVYSRNVLFCHFLASMPSILPVTELASSWLCCTICPSKYFESCVCLEVDATVVRYHVDGLF